MQAIAVFHFQNIDVADQISAFLKRFSFKSYVAGFFVHVLSFPLVQTIESAGKKLSRIVGRYENLRKEIQNFDDGITIDPDFKVREELEKSSSHLQKMAQQLEKIQQNAMLHRKVRLMKIAAECIDVVRETRSQVFELMWEIAEHDANNAVRQEGFRAHSVEESNALLDRIAAMA